MVYRIGYIKDSVNQNYLGIKLNDGVMDSFLNELEEIVDDKDQFELLVKNQQIRDNKNGHTHHSTLINVFELNTLLKSMGSKLQERVEIIQSMEITDLSFKGVGMSERAGNMAYYVVIESPTMDEMRSSLGLDKKDFHITLGFDRKDVFGVRKNQVIKKKAD